jgi:hypothetical protein
VALKIDFVLYSNTSYLYEYYVEVDLMFPPQRTHSNEYNNEFIRILKVPAHPAAYTREVLEVHHLPRAKFRKIIEYDSVEQKRFK